MAHRKPSLPPWCKTAAILLVALTVIILPLHARAGGAGGGHSSSSSSSSSGWSSSSSGRSSSGDGGAFLFYLVFELIGAMYRTLGPVPATLILGGIVAGLWAMNRMYRKAKSSSFRYLEPDGAARKGGDIPESGEGSLDKNLENFAREHPDFDPESFRQKASTAFLALQEAWSAQDLSKVRPFLSDGVYQRFRTQFDMMQRLSQKNLLDNVKILRLSIASVRKDGPFDLLEVRFDASMRDRFTSPLLPGQDQEGHEAFTEYWTFLRRQDASGGGDLYHNRTCPHCSAPFPEDLGESGTCPYCSSQINSGVYDWVLSEITQEQDRAGESALREGLGLKAIHRRIRKDDPEMGIQAMEDLASNAWMQLLRARTDRNPLLARRFVSDRLYGKLAALSPLMEGTRLAWNRLFLNQVVLAGAGETGEWRYLDFLVTASMQAVEILPGPKARLKDPAIREEQQILRLMRKKEGALPARGSIYQHLCGSCGAPVQDSADTACPYCHTPFNAGVTDWVVEDLVPRNAWDTLEKGIAPRKALDPASIDRLMDVKDFAVNNLIIMAAADGRFAPEEKEAMMTLIRRLHYPVANLDALFQLARTGQLRLRMPDDVTKRRKITAIMEELALVDGDLDPREQEILDSLKGMISDIEVLRF